MSGTSTTAMLVGTPDMFAERANAITATILRDEIAEALATEPPADLILDVLRRPPDREEPERRTVNIAWTQDDLESLLKLPGGEAVTFYFDPDELERLLEEPDVEGHGVREVAVALSIAAAAAAVGAGNAAAASDPGSGSSQAQASTVIHDEASLTERGIGLQATGSIHDEATLVERGIERAPAVHDEAGYAARGIEPGTTGPQHDEAGLVARGIVEAPAVHDEASLTARGIEPSSGPSIHDEASLVDRGIVEAPAVHDEAGLVARGIDPSPAVHDEAGLVARGIVDETPTVVGDTGSGFDFPSVDPGAAAAVAGAMGAGLLIVGAAFATRRRQLGHP